MTEAAESREHIAVNLKAMIADAEELLSATAGATGERIATARARAQATLKAAREKLAGLDDAVIDQAKEAAHTADEYVREHALGAVGIAAIDCSLLGLTALALLLGSLGGVVWMRWWLKRRPPMFATTVAELRKDRERLGGP